MNAIPLVRASAVLPFVRFLNQIGSPTDRLLNRVKLPVLALEEPEALLPLNQTIDFAEQAAQLERIDLLGIIVGQRTQIAELGVFGHLVQQSLTLYELLHTIEQKITLYNSGERFWLTEEGVWVWLHHEYIIPRSIKNQQAEWYTLLLSIRAVQLATGTDWNPPMLYSPFNSSRGLTEIEELANVPVQFNQPNGAIAIPKSILSLPLHPSRNFQTLSPQECNQYLQSTAPALEFSKSLQQFLQPLLQDGYPDISLAADAIGISVRSFQRRLAEANLSYSRIVEQVRFDRAIQLLHDPSIQLIDIAAELGYTDPANFTRAFKRWTGTSPREYRRLHIGVD